MDFLETVYNFTYRLSGDRDVAEILTEKVFLTQPANRRRDDIVLLKQAWEDFLRYYGRFDFDGENMVQQSLLRLSPEIRCAVILRDILGYSYSQIAFVLDESELTVGRLISLARRDIKKRGIKQNISS